MSGAPEAGAAGHAACSLRLAPLRTLEANCTNRVHQQINIWQYFQLARNRTFRSFDEETAN
jgi:hypothetical protein